jgi:hypothetical protein
MATLEFDGLLFEGALKVTLRQAPERIDVLPGAAQPPAWPHLFRFGTTQTTPERLKIDAPTVCFDWEVRASGKGGGRDWEAGVLQSVSHASWGASYADGAELGYRLNTGLGLLRDGDPNGFFLRWGHPLGPAAAPDTYGRKVSDSDAPGVTLVTEFSGDPLRPYPVPGGGVVKLNRTEGKVNFHTFLAVVNKRTGSVLTLAECHWGLTWDGAYDFASKTWSPDDPDGIIILNERDRAVPYADPRGSAVSLPFSLEPPVANQRKEILAGGQWTACEEGLPKLGA